MRKHYFLTACAALMLTATPAMAAGGDLLTQNKATNLPQSVLTFLNTATGKNYSEAQFQAAMKQGATTAEAPKKALKYTTVFAEDFAKWTAGSEDAPDAADITEDSTKMQTYMATPGGWTGLMAYQAGGAAYFGYDTENGPGYLKTPSIDLRGKDGVYRIKMRARSVNPDNETQMLQVFSLDEGNSSIINATAYEFGKTWTDLEWVLAGGAEFTSIMFYGNSGKVLVDDFTIETIEYPLATPSSLDASLADVDQVEVKWSAVEGATSYYVYAEDSDDDDKLVAETTVSGTGATLTFIPNGDDYYRIYVIAKNGDDESYPKSWRGKFAPSEIGNPVALAATNVTDNGFTANWEKGKNAAQTILEVSQKHVATADGEVFELFNDDFSTLNDATMNDLVVVAQMGYCDKYFKRSGWYADVCAGFGGVIGITNAYAGYGLPGRLMSPKMDFSVGGGTVKVSGKAQSMQDDAVMSIYFYNGLAKVGEKTVNVSTTGGTFDVELTGGKANTQLVFCVTDAIEGGDFVFLDDVKITTTMSKGESITLPYSTYYVDYPATSYDVTMPLAGEDNAYYTVQGYFSDELKSKVSSEITVKNNESGIASLAKTGKAAVKVTADGVTVSNPKRAAVAVYGIDGRIIARTGGSSVVTMSLPNGAYIVRVGGETFKIAK